MPKTSIYLSEEDHKYLVRLAGTLQVKLGKKYSISSIIHMLIRFLKLIHQHGMLDDLGYFLESKDKELLDLFLTKP